MASYQLLVFIYSKFFPACSYGTNSTLSLQTLQEATISRIGKNLPRYETKWKNIFKTNLFTIYRQINTKLWKNFWQQSRCYFT